MTNLTQEMRTVERVRLVRLMGNQAQKTLLLLAAGFSAVLYCLVAWQRIVTNFGDEVWEQVVLLSTYMVRDGKPLYFRMDRVPALTTMYGPFNYYLLLPVTFAKSPTVALHAASIWCGCIFLLPLVALLRTARNRGHLSTQTAALAVAVFTTLTLYYQFSENSFCGVVPATICVGVGGLAVLASSTAAKRNSVLGDLIAIALIVIACLSKQVMAPLVVLYPVLVFVQRGMRASIFTGLRIVAGILAGIGLACLLNDPIAMYLHTIWIPAHQPWQGHLCFLEGASGCTLVFSAREKALTLATLVVKLLRNFDYLFMGVAGGAVLLFKSKESFKQSYAMPFALAWFFLLPTSLLNVAKAGGMEVNFLICTFFLYMAACGLVVDLERIDPERQSHYARLTLALLALPLICNAARFLHHPSLHYDAGSDPTEVSFESAKNSRSIYFPWYPLSTYLATGRTYNFPQALVDRESAGMPVTPEFMQSGLPPDAEFYAYYAAFESKGDQAAAKCSAAPANLRLPGWNVVACAPGGSRSADK